MIYSTAVHARCYSCICMIASAAGGGKRKGEEEKIDSMRCWLPPLLLSDISVTWPVNSCAALIAVALERAQEISEEERAAQLEKRVTHIAAAAAAAAAAVSY